jgi:hypothetical protein
MEEDEESKNEKRKSQKRNQKIGKRRNSAR